MSPAARTTSAALDELAAVAMTDPRLLVGRALQAARDVLDMEIAYLADLDETEQVFHAVSPEALIEGVTPGASIPRRESYCDRMIAGVIPNCVPDTTADDATSQLVLTRLGVRSYVGVPIERPDGHVDGTLCCLSRSPDPDVAERELAFMRVLARLLGDQLAREAYQHEQDVKREGMAAMASHDLRTPVTAVLGYAELLEGSSPPLTERQLEHLTAIRRAGTQLSELAEHLLDVARVPGTEAEVARDRVDLGEVAADAIALLGPSAAEAGLTLAGETGDEELAVDGDRSGLLRLTENLIGNAIKYTPDGGRVDVRVHRAGGSVVLEVADTGCGIPLAEQDRVFEPFYRARNGREAAAGSGLGLAVCRQVVAAHDGTLTLRSAPDAGTTVTVALPAYESGSE